MVVAPFSSPPSAPEERPRHYGSTTVSNPAKPDTVPDSSLETIVASASSTVPSFNRFAVLRFCRPQAMATLQGKRKVDTESSNEDSPSSMNGADHTDKGWTTNRGGDWRTFTCAFGLTGSSAVARRRGRRGTRKGLGGGGGGDEKDPMQELLEIVLWNGEKEIDITEELTDEYDSDEEDLAAIKRAMAREQTIRPRGAFGLSRMESGGKKKSVGGGGEGKTNRMSSGGLSVSNLRFDSLLKIGSTSESTKKSTILRLEQRTNTMDQAFKGVLDDSYICESTSSSSKKVDLSTRTVSSATLVAGAEGGDEENFWDDVEF